MIEFYRKGGEKMKKKILKKALAGVMLVSVFTFIPVTKANAETENKIFTIDDVTTSSAEWEDNTSVFTDVANDHWAISYIKTMKEMGIINGYDDGTFKPENKVKLCEFLKMATASIWKIDTEKELPEGAHWIYPYAKVANHFLIASNVYSNEDWEKYITREKAVEIIWKMYMTKHPDVKVNKQGEELKRYTDEATITTEESRRYFEWCIQLGLVDGFEDGTLKPQNTLTRAEAAKLILFAQ